MKKAKTCIQFFLTLAVFCAAQTDPQSLPSSSQRFIMVNPDSMIQVGFDYDGDNRVDAYRSIRGSDLMNEGRPMRPGPYEYRTRAPIDQMPMNSLSGEIEDLKQVRLSGLSERHVIARVKTDQDHFYTVDLGPKDQISQLDLKNGDWITVRGVQGSINRNKTLMAFQIGTNEQQIDVDRPQGSDQLRFAGQIRETTVRSLGPNRPDHLLALVELENNEKVVVDLGSNEILESRDIDLSRNDKVVFLARPEEFEGRHLLKATRLSVDGEVVQTNI